MDRAASLFVLLLLLLFPVRSLSEEETDGSLTQRCVGQAAELKRVNDIDYDSFVSLMGKRRAAQTDPHRNRNVPVSRKRHEEEVLADLLRRRTRTTCRCKQD